MLVCSKLEDHAAFQSRPPETVSTISCSPLGDVERDCCKQALVAF